MTTVRDAKRVQASLAEALAAAAEFLGRHPEHAALGAQATMAAARMSGGVPAGKEADQADPTTVSTLRDAAGVGRAVISQTDAGRKVPRLTKRIEEAEQLLGAG
jgi:hypothetical protein